MGLPDIHKVMLPYHLGKIKSTQILTKGIENLNIRIDTDQGKYVFRIYQNPAVRTKEYITFELELLQFLAKKRLPVPKVMPTKKGEVLVKVGGYQGCLFTFIDGKDTASGKAWQAEQVGSFLGKLHKTTKSFNSEYAKHRRIINPTETRRLLTERIKASQAPSLAEKLVSFQTHLPPSLPKDLPEGCVHVDLHDESALFRDKRLVGVLDWDDAFYGPLLFDFPVPLTWYCVWKGRIDFHLTKALLDGYEKHRKITEKEKKMLWPFCFLVGLWYVSYMLDSRFDHKKTEVDVSIRQNIAFLEELFRIGEREFYEAMFR